MNTPTYDKSERVDLSDERIHWDLGASISYGEYLNLEKVLNAQKPLSQQHDEMLFIIVHQTSELWLRLFLHEIAGVLECVRRDDLDPSFKMLSRIGRVQTQLIATWDVLATMTPSEDRKSTRLNSSHGYKSYAVLRDLHSFPTRRSSDLRCCSSSCTRPRSCGCASSCTRSPGCSSACGGTISIRRSRCFHELAGCKRS